MAGRVSCTNYHFVIKMKGRALLEILISVVAIFIRPGSPPGLISDVAPTNSTIWTQGGVKDGHDLIFLVLLT